MKLIETTKLKGLVCPNCGTEHIELDTGINGEPIIRIECTVCPISLLGNQTKGDTKESLTALFKSISIKK